MIVLAARPQLAILSRAIAEDKRAPATALGHGGICCLLPVRNAADSLPDWLESIGVLADCVVALDDGSIDDTAAILRRHPLVEVVLQNPRRPTARGWHDGANRARLVEAAAHARPEWLVFLDSDEFLDAEDAMALRQFLQTDALAGFAYGLHHYRMWIDHRGKHLFDPEGRYIYRVFAFGPDLRLPQEALHFDPVPIAIPPERRLPTTVRVRHYGAASEHLVAARLAKYAEADPMGTYRVDFGNLDRLPAQSWPEWRPRLEGLPVLVGTPPIEPALLDLDAPAISAVVIATDDAPVIAERLQAVAGQECGEAFEVIVVVSGSHACAQEARRAAALAWPADRVDVIELPERVLPGAARNAGLSVARGDVVTFPGSHVELVAGALEARRQAHLKGFSMVAAATRNGNRTPAGWASYLLDHSAALPGRPPGEIGGPPGNCSYDAAALRSIGGFAEHLRCAEDTAVNVELTRRGHRAWFEPDAVQVHHSPCRTPSFLVRHHFRRGRGLARVAAPLGRHRLLGAWREMHPRARSRRIAEHVGAWGSPEDQAQHARHRRLVSAGAWAYVAGFLAELAVPRLSTWRALIGRTGITLALVGLDARANDPTGRADVIVLARLGFLDRSLRLVSVPRDLLVELPGHGRQKVNAAYPLGGGRLLREALLRAFGVPIDGFITIDFRGFRRVIDALGGVEVDVAYPLFDPLSNEEEGLVSADFRAGRQIVSGKAALAYARSRRIDGDSARRHRQLDLVVAIVDRLRRTRSPWKLAWVAVSAARAVRIAIPLRHLARLVVAGRWLRPDRIHTDSVEPPLVNGARLDDGNYVQTGDHDTIVGFVRSALSLS